MWISNLRLVGLQLLEMLGITITRDKGLLFRHGDDGATVSIKMDCTDQSISKRMTLGQKEKRISTSFVVSAVRRYHCL
jgi:hypothetical protein